MTVVRCIVRKYDGLLGRARRYQVIAKSSKFPAIGSSNLGGRVERGIGRVTSESDHSRGVVGRHSI